MATLPNTTWTFNLSDTDPVFRYLPYSDGQFENGWEAGFTGVGLNPPDQGHNDGIGQSFHVTSFPEASVSLSFFGTRVSLFGQANCSYDVVLDGSIASVNAPPPSGTLYTGSNLDNTVHNITLTPHPVSSDQTLNFTGAQLASLVSSSLIPERVDNQNTSVISYSGSWTVHNAHQIPSPEHPAPYFQTDKSGSAASLNFTGRAVAVRGESNFGWWTYSADLDGTLYTMNASSTFIIPDALLFYQDGLDENVAHTLTLTNTGGDGMFFALNSITIYRSSSASGAPPSASSSAPANSQSASLSAGALAGIVVGAVLALIGSLGFTLLIVRLKRRRPETVTEHQSIEPYEQPATSQTTMTEPLATRKGGLPQRAELQATVTSERTPVDVRKLSAIPSQTSPCARSHDSSPIDPSSSATRPSEPTDYNRIADAVVERIAMRFGPADFNEDGSPPRYPG